MKRKPKCVFRLTRLAFPIRLEETAPGRFAVVYGKQDIRQLSYADAAKELGECIFHALACDGRLTNGRS